MLRIPYALVVNFLRIIKFILAFVFTQIVSLFNRSEQYVQIRIPNEIPFGLTKRMRWFNSGTSLLDLREDFKRIAEDPDVKGVVLEFETMALSSFFAAELSKEIRALKEKGKTLIARADTFTSKTLMVASLCDQVVIAPSGRIYPFGGRIESTFLRGIFERAGITAQFIHIGEFKAAANRYVRNDMSPSQRTMMQSLLNSMEDKTLQILSSERKVEAKAALQGGPFDPRRARSRSLIDGEAFESDIARWIAEGTMMTQNKGEETDKKSKLHLTPLANYSGRLKLDLFPFRGAKKIALVDLQGVIVGPGMPSRGKTINSAEVIPLLRQIKKNPKIAGVILHINSPGGSALASDIMWNEIKKLRSEKPVVALCSDVAASGGYYLAVGTDRIVCREETITGSIGVITGKFSGSGLAEKIGLGVDTITNDESSAFMSMYAPLGDQDLENFKQEARSFYRRFLERVGMARKISKRRLHRYGRGRVYMGGQAIERDLVDRLDGLDGAIDEIRKLIGKGGSNLKLEFFSTEKVNFRTMISKSTLSSLRALSKVENQLDHLELALHERTLALMPFSIQEKG